MRKTIVACLSFVTLAACSTQKLQYNTKTTYLNDAAKKSIRHMRYVNPKKLVVLPFTFGPKSTEFDVWDEQCGMAYAYSALFAITANDSTGALLSNGPTMVNTTGGPIVTRWDTLAEKWSIAYHPEAKYAEYDSTETCRLLHVNRRNRSWRRTAEKENIPEPANAPAIAPMVSLGRN